MPGQVNHAMIRDLYCPSCGARVGSYGGPMPSVICPRCYRAVLVPMEPFVPPAPAVKSPGEDARSARARVPPMARCPNSRCGAPVGADHPCAWCLECLKPLPEAIVASLPEALEQRANRAAAVAKFWGTASFASFVLFLAEGLSTLLFLRRDSQGRLVTEFLSKHHTDGIYLSTALTILAVFLAVSAVGFLIWLLQKVRNA